MTARVEQQSRGQGRYIAPDTPPSPRHASSGKHAQATTVDLPPEQSRLQSLFPLDRPVNPHMSGQDVRQGTFRSEYGDRWPRDQVRATPEQIAEAGFFYLGERDRVKCWYCNGGLQNWERDDDPWKEHAKWFPNCQLVLREKGPDFVHAISSQFPNLNRPRMRPMDIPPSPRFHIVFNSNGEWSTPRSTGHPPIIDPREEARKRERQVQTAMESSPQVQQARIMGFEDEVIKRALIRQYQEKDRNFGSLDELIDAVTSIDVQPPSGAANQSTSGAANNVQNTASNNTEDQIKRLEEERNCKMCHSEKSTVVFVPCGHLAACAACSRTAHNCPICGSYVREKIKAFLS